MHNTPKPQIVIAGAGCIGRILAHDLALAGVNTAVLTKTKDSAADILQNGISILRDGASSSCTPAIASSCPADLIKVNTSAVFICVKCPDTSDTARAISPYISKSTPVVLVQNGAGAYDEAACFMDRNQLFCGIASFGANIREDGTVMQFGGTRMTLVPCPGGSGSRPESIINGLPDLRISYDTDALSVIWSKLCLNCGINPVSAIYGINNRDLLKHNHAWTLALDAANEAYRTAKRLGIRLKYDDVEHELRRLCQSTSGNITSMLQDITKGRRTEIDFINGFVIRQAEPCDIDVPCNKHLYERILSIQKQMPSSAVNLS